ncbi:MAG: T9SS type A sorting domain-containing protein [Bacteroidales bacterium]|nr:T9SS type A sorting domain-containing protein [Bacteroidales bacterium]
MQYNLLHYGNYFNDCTESNNNVADKNEYLKTIIQYVKPDIFTVNEMGKEQYFQYLLMNDALNVDGVTKYKKANYSNVANSYIVNMLYYNSEKLVLKSQSVAQNYIRDIDVYRLYHKSSDLELGDTAFIYCVVAHLKAGNDPSDISSRTNMVNNSLSYLNGISSVRNYLFMGDLNTKTSSEQCYYNLMNYSNQNIKFYDPVNKPGNWNSNYNFRYYHTQSTHYYSNGCFSSGGMDDRFDFILINNQVKNGLRYVKYVSGSYETLGQDGKHYNDAINYIPTNTSVPSDVLNALYNMSDHLPVILKLEINKTLSIPENDRIPISSLNFNNPVNEELKLNIITKSEIDIIISINSVLGKQLFQKDFSDVRGLQYNIPFDKFSKGFYLLSISDKHGNKIVRKIIKN